jgi:hypothetical protein
VPSVRCASSLTRPFPRATPQENIKSILDGIMDSHGAEVRRLARRPVLKLCFEGLITRWEQNHAPPPIVAPEPPKAAEDELKCVDCCSRSCAQPSADDRLTGRRRSERAEEDYFGGSDDEAATTTAGGPSQRKRQKTNPDGVQPSTSILFTPASSSDAGAKGLDLGYDDSDSDDDMKDGPATPATDAMELDPADAIEDVARQMTEKRRRDEEEDDDDGGFGKLLGANGGSTKGGGHRRSGGFSAAASLSSSESLRKLGEIDGAGGAAAVTGGPPSVGPNRPVKSDGGGGGEPGSKPQGKLKFSLGGFRFGASKADK